MAEKRSLSLSLRLVITYGLLIAGTLLVVAGLVVYLTRSHLEQRLDDQVLTVANSFASGPALQVQHVSDLEPAARRWLARQALPRDQVVAVRTVSGKVLTTTGGLDIGSLEEAETLLSRREPQWRDVEGPGAGVRVLSLPLVLRGRDAGTLVVAASEAEIGRTLQALLTGMGWAAGTGLLFAGVLGFLIVRKTLRPLTGISEEAASIQETGDLSRRVAYRGPRDEVGTLAAAFDRMLERLEEAFSSQRRFLADASHELRTPLTVVRGQLELLQEEIGQEQRRRSVRVGTEEIDRMSRIVEELLLLARLEEGLPLRREPVEVELVLQDALVRGMGAARRQAKVEAETGLFAEADPERLLQVLSNLVTNAVKHAGEDAGIALSARTENGVVRVEVSDTGRGIPKADIAHVFERLFRSSSPQTDAPPGAGLGLAIARSLVEAMGGSIFVSSTPGVGTTFTILLPRAGAGAPAPSSVEEQSGPG